MVTPGGSYPIVDGEHKLIAAMTYYGLSTDTKPTEGIGNGSCFLEMDTGKLYFYDASEGGSGWIEWGAGS